MIDEPDDNDIQDFSYDLVKAVMELSKKHSDPNYKIHLPISMIEAIRMLNFYKKKNKEEEAE